METLFEGKEFSGIFSLKKVFSFLNSKAKNTEFIFSEWLLMKILSENRSPGDILSDDDFYTDVDVYFIESLQKNFSEDFFGIAIFNSMKKIFINELSIEKNEELKKEIILDKIILKKGDYQISISKDEYEKLKRNDDAIWSVYTFYSLFDESIFYDKNFDYTEIINFAKENFKSPIELNCVPYNHKFGNFCTIFYPDFIFGSLGSMDDLLYLNSKDVCLFMNISRSKLLGKFMTEFFKKIKSNFSEISIICVSDVSNFTMEAREIRLVENGRKIYLSY